MSFFDPTFFKATVSATAEKPVKAKQIPDNKPKDPHGHFCQTCLMSYRCNFANCRQPDKVLECYACKPSHFQTFVKKNG